MLRIILTNSFQNYTKSATKFFEHGFDPPPPLNNVKKTDDLVLGVVPKKQSEAIVEIFIQWKYKLSAT